MIPDAPLSTRLSLMAITDPVAKPGLVPAAIEAIRAGAPALQIRWKGATARQLLSLADELRPVARATGALLIVNDRLDVAIAAHADGVHLGDDDIPLEVARRIAPTPFLIGRSVDTVADAIAAERDGADYIGAGPVHPTNSKGDTGPIMGVEGISRICEAVTIPVLGIGGIAPGTAAEVVRAGAAGVAVLGGIMFADDAAEATRQLLEEVAGQPS
ncbi:MAG TPA: thiamine phosphate synthase [Longimicrobiaceae bacterium]|nr:thiamine phosphate synthase [Longimicrobiaceae bacterium]